MVPQPQPSMMQVGFILVFNDWIQAKTIKAFVYVGGVRSFLLKYGKAREIYRLDFMVLVSAIGLVAYVRVLMFRFFFW